ncbi:metallophosphoesterase [Streptomyces sp. NPDC059134]|uniref:metallophosphoesterase n=1 Tax=Streptomyces sp. NPDC059134 TaxID=3346738 RepID=UPI0036A5F472
MVVVVVLAVLAVVAVLVSAHWYVWRRLVRDTTSAPGPARRLGTVAIILLPLLSVGALSSSRSGAPFLLQQILAWPGFLWLATLLYLVLALVVAEAVRPLLRRYLARGDAAGAVDPAGKTAEPTTPTGPRDTGAPEAGATAKGKTERTEQAPARTDRDAKTRSAAGTATKTATEPATDATDARIGTKPATDAAGATGARTGAKPATDAAGATGARTGTKPATDAAGATGARTGTETATGSGTPAAPAPQPATPAPSGPSRRLFVSRAVGGAAATAALATVGYGTYGVLRGPSVKRVTVPLAKLPRAAHGFRIAVVSDIHLGPILGSAHTRRIVRTINSTRPDLIAVVGDLVDGTVRNLGSAAEPLSGLEAPHGSFFVTGNHEYFSGAAEWVDHVRELGLRPLENERVEIAGFDLAGVNDIAGESEGEGPDFVKALGDRDPARASVLLAHQPVVIHDAVRHGVDLQLSGHTHGGQLWPGNLLAGFANPTVAGLERYQDTQLYVSRGAGAWGPPVRVGAPSDITVVELASRQA